MLDFLNENNWNDQSATCTFTQKALKMLILFVTHSTLSCTSVFPHEWHAKITKGTLISTEIEVQPSGCWDMRKSQRCASNPRLHLPGALALFTTPTGAPWLALLSAMFLLSLSLCALINYTLTTMICQTKIALGSVKLEQKLKPQCLNFFFAAHSFSVVWDDVKHNHNCPEQNSHVGLELATTYS